MPSQSHCRASSASGVAPELVMRSGVAPSVRQIVTRRRLRVLPASSRPGAAKRIWAGLPRGSGRSSGAGSVAGPTLTTIGLGGLVSLTTLLGLSTDLPARRSVARA